MMILAILGDPDGGDGLGVEGTVGGQGRARVEGRGRERVGGWGWGPGGPAPSYILEFQIRS